MELENIILSDDSQAQKTKGYMFSLICEIQTQHKYKQYYEKMGYAKRRSHAIEGG
jgi:hypothetical protein